MGKKSLIKSTSKKKPTAKKAASKTTRQKKTPAEKVAQASTSKSKTKKKTTPRKTSHKTKVISTKDLLKKKYEAGVPKVLYTVPEEMVERSTFTAPEFIAGVSADDAKRIKGLLANTYSAEELKAAAEKAAAEKAAAEKAAAEKAAAEKAAAEKAAAEKAAAEKAAAEKAAAEKAAAEKAAAEKAAAEKAAAEKAAAEKAAAEKAAAEKAAAEKAAAEKAAAEKAAAEKAAAEKAAAEKAAAEKAAAEKAAAEKAAAEKAAAEKAAAEKAAAEKAAAEKAAAEKAAAKKRPSDPIDNSIKLFVAVLAFLILLVIWASTSNSLKYYAIEKDGALELWKGKFAPLGKKIVLVLPGYQVPEETKEIYRSHEVYSMAFQYYLDKAEALMDAPGIPDFEEIKANLKIALSYAPNRDMRSTAYNRLDSIDRLILISKADAAAIRGTISGLTAAIGYLKEAQKLTSDKAQKASIALRIAEYEAELAALEGAAEEEAAVQEQAAANAAAQKEKEAVAPDNAVVENESEEVPTTDAEHH